MRVATAARNVQEACSAFARGTVALMRQVLYLRTYLDYRAARKCYQQRHYEVAKKLFLAVLRANPHHFMTNVYLGRIYTKLENFAEASKRYRVAQEVNPAAYSGLDLIREHMETLKLGAKRGMLRDALGGSEGGGYPIADLSEWVQEAIKKQRQSRDVQSPSKEGELQGRGARPGARAGQAPSARVYPVKSDFESYEEFKKFSDMPPISEEEFRDADWDELLGSD